MTLTMHPDDHLPVPGTLNDSFLWDRRDRRNGSKHTTIGREPQPVRRELEQRTPLRRLAEHRSEALRQQEPSFQLIGSHVGPTCVEDCEPLLGDPSTWDSVDEMLLLGGSEIVPFAVKPGSPWFGWEDNLLGQRRTAPSFGDSPNDDIDYGYYHWRNQVYEAQAWRNYRQNTVFPLIERIQNGALEQVYYQHVTQEQLEGILSRLQAKTLNFNEAVFTVKELIELVKASLRKRYPRLQELINNPPSGTQVWEMAKMGLSHSERKFALRWLPEQYVHYK